MRLLSRCWQSDVVVVLRDSIQDRRLAHLRFRPHEYFFHLLQCRWCNALQPAQLLIHPATADISRPTQSECLLGSSITREMLAKVERQGAGHDCWVCRRIRFQQRWRHISLSKRCDDCCCSSSFGICGTACHGLWLVLLFGGISKRDPIAPGTLAAARATGVWLRRQQETCLRVLTRPRHKSLRLIGDYS